MSKAATACEAVWREARPKGDFARVYPLLSEVLNLARQAAAAKAEKLGCGPYEALMDQYEPGAREVDIDRVFADYGAFLPDFLKTFMSSAAASSAAPAISQVLVYVLMAGVLVWRPTGLFGQRT